MGYLRDGGAVFVVVVVVAMEPQLCAIMRKRLRFSHGGRKIVVLMTWRLERPGEGMKVPGGHVLAGGAGSGPSWSVVAPTPANHHHSPWHRRAGFVVHGQLLHGRSSYSCSEANIQATILMPKGTAWKGGGFASKQGCG